MYKKGGKRIFDVIFSIIVIMILLPLFLFLAIVFIYINKGNPIFTQQRVGKNETIFTILKFKTMRDVNLQNAALPDRVRVTPFGNFCRNSSLDEIPQFWNILKGDMSLIGPRPLLVEYLPQYNALQKRRHQIKPGLSGWAQVNGRNQLSWDQKFALDNWYIDHMSFKLDIKIISITILQVLNFKKVSFESTETTKFFEP